ncbi:DNA-binding domain-containing protein, AraC-type [Sphaerochaeta pleomorpha str. Grapes]|uniref:DNA-binding domain-containing protein, AraC-type n=1 Tax=Sphaerochaeta pleomorpha (strain ATCC BAA-1885 / DSM 22778 / Grapes) TaxID=158190 RepID=G8QUW8_SPHPG|nr:AraC family transcriptional regulator [Sphaerochaeta pleomorpha]AEV28144.1 DNA-binding domain-containing protein, AraC-type [Sphaerochaeta pleomorpha str. Grapes]
MNTDIDSTITMQRKSGINLDAIQKHYHNVGEIIFVYEGSLTMNINERDVSLQASQLVIISSFASHILLHASNECKRYILRFPLDFLLESVKDPGLARIFTCYSTVDIPTFRITKKMYPTIIQLFTLFEKELKEKDDYYKERCGVLLCALLITLYREDNTFFSVQRTPLETKMLEIQFYLTSQYAKDISLDFLAEKFCISKYYMARCFSKFSGVSIKQYLTTIRINQAKQLLCNTADPINLISEKTGFYDSNHFIKMFRKQENQTPLQFRKSSS